MRDGREQLETPPPARTAARQAEQPRERVRPERAERPARPEPVPKPPRPPRPPIKPAFLAAVGLDIIGAGIIAYGLYENGNVVSSVDEGRYTGAAKSARNRNIAYGVGTAALLSGISIHIFF
jgi:hypothetical protein